MARRSQQDSLESLRLQLIDLLIGFKTRLQESDLREKVLSLVPAFRLLKSLGSSLVSKEDASAARDRILFYLRKYPRTVIHGEELMVVSGINEWARRVRELRVQFGWSIISGYTAKEMKAEDDPSLEDTGCESMKPDDYMLLDDKQDRDAALRWHIANEIRRKKIGTQSKILEFFRRNIGQPITSEELRYVANNKSEWARRVRELRTEQGWPIVTRNTGRPDLPVGAYVLEIDRQSPAHDRVIPDPVRRSVLSRDHYKCRHCKWNYEMSNPADIRLLELHHVKPHVEGGENTESNLITLCNVCHDELHRKMKTI